MRRTLTTLLLAGVLAVGCGSPSTSPKTPAPGQQASGGPRKPPPMPPTLPTAGTQPETRPEVVREKAVVGVGKKGRDYEPGLITTPVAVYFRGPQMMAFKIQIPHAMNIYRGVNGHFPKSHEEFMQKIIKENQIQLPDLPPDEHYVYDPKKAAEMRTYDPADPPLFVEHEK